MRVLHLTALALLASSACATPISSHVLLRNHTTTTSLPGMISTSTDFTASAASDLPTFGTCRAFYYDPKDDVPCGVVARQFTIFLTYPEYDQPSTAQWCEVFLNGNGICRATSPNSPSAFPTSKPSTLSISTVAPTTDNVAPVTLTSGSIVSTSRCDTTSSPVAAVVSLHGSIVSVGSASATTSIKTSSRAGVVLASVRASEYSATVVRTSSSAAITGAPAQSVVSNALLAAETNSSAAITFRPAMNTTRMISYGMGSDNATSLKTVLVTAHLAADATAAVPGTTSAGVSSVANSTLAVRVLSVRRQASSLAFGRDHYFDQSSNYQRRVHDLSGSTALTQPYIFSAGDSNKSASYRGTRSRSNFDNARNGCHHE
ncbi:hypothetical protein Slin15195_G013890 [Septoria linicola]|uniref:Uncharacterized protein n=1 Tax=Septoria linicola TaxID=215465 RepID=A0A9Q9AKF7_9PEZI|nr:hypothetical protein Slin15195_G013890 [Septoria linicola]